MLWILIGIVAVVVVVLFIRASVVAAERAEQARLERLAFLTHKYGDEKVARDIMAHRFWVGQTDEQLLESRGRPVDVDQKVLKTKVKETWKYNQTGQNRFALRIKLDDGVVVGWDDKR